MAKATTLDQVEADLMVAEGEYYDEESFVSDMEDALGFVTDAVQFTSDKAERGELREAKRILSACLTRHRRKFKALETKVNKLEDLESELKKQGCQHDRLKCRDCGAKVS